jgi:ABC-type bacteriocin/lantibiotic exporter with double-glycine peptidase domain
VRDFFASTTVVLLVDMSFLVIFLLFIAIIAGWLVIVPLVGMSLMLIAGFYLQKRMGQASLDAQADSSLQHSHLVESIGGIETLKAAGAEGQMLGRWRRYSAMTAATNEKLRRNTAVAVNLATLSQQLMSVGLLIGGFYEFNSGDISMGGIIAIVMLAGRAIASGKSTLGRLLCGLYEPSDGVMTIDALDSRQYHPHQLRESFRFVAQDSELFSGTVRENLMLGAARADDQQLIDAVVRSGADIFLSRDAAGFDLPVGERGNRLSGGQRSLLVLARALVTPCKLLFLDEPTGAMDTQTESYFIDHLKGALAPDQTLVVSTHRHQMLNIVDRLIVIDQGRIVADGKRDEILGRLSRAAKGEKA